VSLELGEFALFEKLVANIAQLMMAAFFQKIWNNETYKFDNLTDRLSPLFKNIYSNARPLI